VFITDRRSSRAARCLLATMFVLASLLAATPLRAAPIGGTLTGKAVMKTAGVAQPTTPLPVTLLFFNAGLFRQTDEAADSRTTMTAPDGSFTFAGLDTSAAGAYRVVVQYKGVGYEPAERDVTDASGTAVKSRAIRFANNATTATTEVPIYEPVVSDSPTSFSVKSDQIIMNEVRPQFYSVLEALQITNAGDRTLVGGLNPDGSVAQGVPLVFTAPANAQTIATNRSDLIPGADLTGQRLTLRTPIQPGASDVTVTYDLPGTPAGLTVTRTLDYAAAKVQVLVSDSRQVIASQTLHNDGALQSPPGATPFKQFSLDNAQAGQTIDLFIGPSPATPPPTAATQPAQSTWDRIRERGTVPFLLTLAVICLLLMFLILRAPARTAASAGGNERAQPIPDADDVAEERTERTARVRGRPHDYDLDDAEREIEAANSETGETRNDRM
jgi:hypothetical protein